MFDHGSREQTTAAASRVDSTWSAGAWCGGGLSAVGHLPRGGGVQLSPVQVLALQRLSGNGAVRQLLGAPALQREPAAPQGGAEQPAEPTEADQTDGRGGAPGALTALKQALRAFDVEAARAPLDALAASVPMLPPGLPAPSTILGQVAQAVPVVRDIEAAVADPVGTLTPVLDDLADDLGEAPQRAMAIIQDNIGDRGPGPTGVTPVVARAETGDVADPPDRFRASAADVKAGLAEALTEKWQRLDVGRVLLDAATTMVWPWPAVARELTGLWADWTAAVDSLYPPANPFTDPITCMQDIGTNLLHLAEFPISLYRHLTAIGLALMGWVSLGLMLLGGFGGSAAGTVLGTLASGLATLGIGAGAGGAAGATAGGWSGAGVGLGVAIGLGQVLVAGFAAGEVMALTRAAAGLFGGRQTPQEQARDVNQVADSGLVLALLVLLAPVGWFGAGVARRALARFVRVLPAPARRAAEAIGEGVRQVREPPPTPTKTGPDPVPETPAVPAPSTARRRLRVDELRALREQKVRVLVWKTRQQDLAANQEIRFVGETNPMSPDRLHFYETLQGAPGYGDNCVLLPLDEAQAMGFRPLAGAPGEWIWDYGVVPPTTGVWYTITDLEASGFAVTVPRR